MSFVMVSGQPTREEAEEITKIWQSSLWNNQVQAEKYVGSFVTAMCFVSNNLAKAFLRKSIIICGIFDLI